MQRRYVQPDILLLIFEDVNLDIDMKTNILSTRYLTVLDSTLGVP